MLLAVLPLNTVVQHHDPCLLCDSDCNSLKIQAQHSISRRGLHFCGWGRDYFILMPLSWLKIETQFTRSSDNIYYYFILGMGSGPLAVLRLPHIKRHFDPFWAFSHNTLTSCTHGQTRANTQLIAQAESYHCWLKHGYSGHSIGP